MFDITLKPAQTEFVALPGGVITQLYNITNNSDTSLTVDASVLPWKPIGFDGSVSYDNVAGNPNIQFSTVTDTRLQSPFVLAPKTTRQIILKINISPNANLGDYYYTFFVSQTETNSLNNSFSGTSGKIGSHILLSVSQTENPATHISVEKFTATPKFKDVFLTPITFNAQINNESGYFFKTVGNITISKDNLVIKKISLTPLNVLSRNSRHLRCEPSCSVSPPFWPGAYTATISFDPSVSDKSFSTTFFVFPFSLIVLLIIPAVLIITSLRLKSSLRKVTSLRGTDMPK